jgi:NADPH:quinone reductase-like Zn-dependent oxidoreductase
MPLPDRMHALTIHRDRYGPPSDALRAETIAAPRLRPSDAKRVLVSILATGPNFNTNFASLGLPVPVFGRGDTATLHVPGSDALGIVVDAGPAVTRVKAGQAVILDSWTGRNIRGYETHDGFNAQFAVLDEERAFPLPAPLRRHSPERLAAMLLTFGTAYRAVVERLRVSPGDSVLVMGGGKGTSFAGAQIAKTLGARVLLAGSNPDLARSLIDRGIADAFVDRTAIPAEVFGPIPPAWITKNGSGGPSRSAAPYSRRTGGTGGRDLRAHRGANFPLLVSALSENGRLAFFGATGAGLRGEYKETFFYQGRRFVMDARWVWMRQKQIFFRKASPESIFDEIRLPPGRRGLIWGADPYARRFARAALGRGAEVAVLASGKREKRGIAELRRMGIPSKNFLDRDAFTLPEDMPDPLTADGRPNPEYSSGFLKHAQALGKALWGVFGPRVSPDFVVERTDGNTMHFSTFVLRDYDEGDAMPTGYVVARGATDLSLLGSHMYASSQANEVLRLLAGGRLAMEQEDLEVTTLSGLPALQQAMLAGAMRKPKGVALVQADRAGRPIAEYEDLFLGEKLRAALPAQGRFIDIRLLEDVAVLTLCRPDALNALNEDLLSQLASVVREIRDLGTVEGKPARAVIVTGAGRAFVAGADVTEFLGKRATPSRRWPRRTSPSSRSSRTFPFRSSPWSTDSRSAGQRAGDERPLPYRDGKRQPRPARGQARHHPRLRGDAAAPPPCRSLEGGRHVRQRGDGRRIRSGFHRAGGRISPVLHRGAPRRSAGSGGSHGSQNPAPQGLGRRRRQAEGGPRPLVRPGGGPGDPFRASARCRRCARPAPGAAGRRQDGPPRDEIRIRKRLFGRACQRRPGIRGSDILSRRPGMGAPVPRQGSATIFFSHPS